jgi:peptide-methionine (S)-S-oxide reductase
MAEQLATLGGGCFWCLDGAFRRVKGVSRVECGYAGGARENPSYEQVCSGATGHAEVIRLHFDDAVISFADVLELFFALHDPTTLNRQGNDVGTQYRSVIFYHDNEQESVAREVMAAQADAWADPVVTELSALPNYYAAEEYHQDYAQNNPQNGYCQMVVNPKLKKFMTTHADRLRD